MGSFNTVALNRVLTVLSAIELKALSLCYPDEVLCPFADEVHFCDEVHNPDEVHISLDEKHTLGEKYLIMLKYINFCDKYIILKKHISFADEVHNSEKVYTYC